MSKARHISRRARAEHPDWFNAPVPTFSGAEPRLLIVGLAPGLRGANRTGRPFTGDFAGDLLYETLLACGLATGHYDQRADDGLTLIDCAIANAVRCVPPQNKPLPAEIACCRPHLTATIDDLPKVEALLALGRIAHDPVVAHIRLEAPRLAFRAWREPNSTRLTGARSLEAFRQLPLLALQHQYGRADAADVRDVLQELRAYLDAAPPASARNQATNSAALLSGGNTG